MRLKMFLVAALAVVACAGSYLDLAARCRCDRPERGGGSRRAARIERRAARRGNGTAVYVQPDTAPNTYHNPYGSDVVVPMGFKSASAAVVETEIQWRCGPRGCYPVRVPVVRPIPPEVTPTPRPTPDPAFKATVPPPPKEKEAATSVDKPEVTIDELPVAKTDEAWQPDPKPSDFETPDTTTTYNPFPRGR